MIVHDTRVGPLYLDASAAGLTRCGFRPPDESAPTPASSVLDHARRELDAYFDDELRTFTVAVDLSGHAPFDRRVLAGLASVGHGERTTYGELAAAVGLGPGDARRVGAAMARNPVAIVVPCHRVVGADGSLTGYAGGLARKRTLLDLEARESTPQLW